MKRFLLLILVVAIAMVSRGDTSLIIRAMSNDPRVADAAIATLRERGPRGVELMVQSAPTDGPESLARYRAALDRVCQQRDCYTSQLYWYTDLEAAKAVAKATGKPILSLHLLGDLSAELSCANSRFFRTTLYSSPTIAKYMRENFVLHWRSVRPVPMITVEFGDGRRIRQTITGNSIHYLLDAEGKPLDALPGLYSPDNFLSHLQTFANLAKEYSGSSPDVQRNVLQVYHNAQWSKIADELGDDLRRIRMSDSERKKATAREAARMTMTKMAGERSLLALFDLPRQPINDWEWKRITSKHNPQVEFDPASVALMREKAGSVNTFDRMLKNLRESVAEDTIRNEYDFHRRIHEWMLNDPAPQLVELNERVYAQLFLTPSSDPWLGLVQEDRFTAIKNAGIEMP